MTDLERGVLSIMQFNELFVCLTMVSLISYLGTDCRIFCGGVCNLIVEDNIDWNLSYVQQITDQLYYCERT